MYCIYVGMQSICVYRCMRTICFSLLLLCLAGRSCLHLEPDPFPALWAVLVGERQFFCVAMACVAMRYIYICTGRYIVCIYMLLEASKGLAALAMGLWVVGKLSALHQHMVGAALPSCNWLCASLVSRASLFYCFVVNTVEHARHSVTHGEQLKKNKALFGRRVAFIPSGFFLCPLQSKGGKQSNYYIN